MSETGSERTRDTAEAVARRSYGRLVAFLAARTRDVAGAEDALSEAFTAALADWPASGVPANPEGWLMSVARRKSIDALRRTRRGEGAGDHLRLLAEELESAAADQSGFPDHRLALMFVCAHPAIDPRIRAPLILQTILGLDAAAIASAFLISPATMSQRLVRAKNKIREAGIPFRMPDTTDLRGRLQAVLDSIYAAFTKGWSDPAGSGLGQGNLADEGLWLGRLVASLLPDEAEALGLLALMLHSQARRAARRNAEGAYVPLDEQDPTLWDAAMMEEAEALLLRAGRMGTAGRYQLEAAVQSAHAVRRHGGRSDWPAIEAFYTALLAITESPVVAINLAVATAETRGPSAGLAALETLRDDARFDSYQPYWAARADLRARAGNIEAADEAYRRAIGLESDPAVRCFLQQRHAQTALAGQDGKKP